MQVRKVITALSLILAVAAGGAPAAAAEAAESAFGATVTTDPEIAGRRGATITVRFDSQPTRLTFRPPASVHMVTDGGLRYWNGYAETFDEKNCEGCCEVIQDRECRYARMWIERRSAARVVVRCRGALNDAKYRIAHTDVASGSPYGRGDWVDESYTVYPDGVHVRTVTIHTGLARRAGAFWGRPGKHPFECQETIVLGPKGHQPPDDIELGAVTLIRMDGRSRTIRWKPYPKPTDLFPGANIQLVNVKGRYRPFTIVPAEGVEIRPYYGPAKDRQHIDKTVFVAWPRVGHFTGGYTSALTHIINWRFHERTDNTITRIYLAGLTGAATGKAPAELLALARSWLTPPRLAVTAGPFEAAGYDARQRAYVLDKRPGGGFGSEELRFQTRNERPHFGKLNLDPVHE